MSRFIQQLIFKFTAIFIVFHNKLFETDRCRLSAWIPPIISKSNSFHKSPHNSRLLFIRRRKKTWNWLCKSCNLSKTKAVGRKLMVLETLVDMYTTKEDSPITHIYCFAARYRQTNWTLVKTMLVNTRVWRHLWRSCGYFLTSSVPNDHVTHYGWLVVTSWSLWRLFQKLFSTEIGWLDGGHSPRMLQDNIIAGVNRRKRKNKYGARLEI